MFEISQPSFFNLPECGKCGLSKRCESPMIEFTGDGSIPIMFIVDAPTFEDDMAGRLIMEHTKLYSVMREYGVSLSDCRYISALSCYSPFKQHTPPRIKCCLPNVEKDIKHNKPKVIVPMGKAATYSVLGNTYRKGFGSQEKWFGHTIPLNGAWICPTLPPWMVVEMKKPQYEVIFRKHISIALNKLKEPVPKFSVEVVKLKKKKEVRDYLSSLLADPPEMLAVDFETSGLKPWNEGHFIYTVAFSSVSGHAYAMPVFDDLKPLYREVLVDKRIKKIAANIKYEIKWAKVHLDADIEPWAWDTMLAAHTADPRTGITSLKFQAFIQFGIPPYDEDVEKLWKDTASNEINRIRMADKDALLLYNGMDAGLEYMLALKQMKGAGYVNGI